MEIIKRGKTPENRSYRTTCDNCGTVFKFQQLEATYMADNRDGDYLEIDCPVCGKEVRLQP